MKFGTELRVLGDYATALYSSSNVPVKASFNCTVVDFLSEFVFTDAAESISSELFSEWFCTKNCVSCESNVTDFLNEILSKELGHFKYFST
jgi:hypothetical protein